MMLFVVFNRTMELRLLVSKKGCHLLALSFSWGSELVTNPFWLLVGLQGKPLIVRFLKAIVAVELNLMLQLRYCKLELLVLEFQRLQRDNQRIFVLEEGVIGLAELLLLDIGEGVELCLPHGPEGIQFVLDLLIGLDDFLDGPQGLLVLLLVIAHNQMCITIDNKTTSITDLFAQ